MLTIKIPEIETFDEVENRFYRVKATSLTLEHSLMSISKWESKWHKAFLGRNEKTMEETIDYIRCMTLTQNVDPNVYKYLPANAVQEIIDYIRDPMSATCFGNRNDPRGSNEPVTSELIYYWMVALQIPFDPCQKWHLNRLMRLIRICEIKNSPPKKMSKSAIYARNRSLNNARRAAMHTKG